MVFPSRLQIHQRQWKGILNLELSTLRLVKRRHIACLIKACYNDILPKTKMKLPFCMWSVIIGTCEYFFTSSYISTLTKNLSELLVCLWVVTSLPFPVNLKFGNLLKVVIISNTFSIIQTPTEHIYATTIPTN